MDLRGAKSNAMSASGADRNSNCPFIALAKRAQPFATTDIEVSFEALKSFQWEHVQ